MRRLGALLGLCALLVGGAGQGQGEQRGDALTLQATLRAHQARVNALAFSADGHLLATAGADRDVYLWTAETGERLRRLDHDHNVTAVAFSIGGEQLFTAGGEQIQRWTVPGGQVTGVWREPAGTVTAMAASVSGHVAVGTTTRAVGLWDSRAGTRRELGGHSGTVRALRFTPDGARLLSGGDDGTVRVWEVGSGRLQATLEIGAPVSALDLNKAGEWLAVATLSGVTEVWRWQEARRAARLPGEAGVVSVTFSLDERLLRTGSFDRQIRLWNWQQQPPRLLSAEAQPATVTALTYSRDGRRLAVARSAADDSLNAALYRTEGSLVPGPLPPAPAPSPGSPASPGAGRRLFVLGVGVEVFQSPAVSALNYTVDDVTELALLFEKAQNNRLYGRVVSRILLNADATRARILQSMEDIARATTPQDTVYVFFASHGENEGDEYYFLPHDVRSGDQGSAISGREMTEFVGRIPGRVVVFLDTCHAGRIDRVKDSNPAAFIARASRIVAATRPGTPADKVFLSAAGPGQLSNEAQGLTNGFFSYALLEGLRGGARPAAQQPIGLLDLLGFVQRRVPELVAARPGAAPQNPVATGAQDNWPLMP
ncbi:caspase family protein [Deinococcus sp. NW-56]|uniref:caspase family protein n=1 Tax=Deinococcus sp. NW-56 TaxID=2080419 RepID=UPI001319CFDE|nr:caspase family protein [Deinococcus sp. NW-56]